MKRMLACHLLTLLDLNFHLVCQLLELISSLDLEFLGSTLLSAFATARNHLTGLKVRKQVLATLFDNVAPSKVDDHGDSQAEFELQR
jgi:hypothetical protein